MANIMETQQQQSDSVISVSPQAVLSVEGATTKDLPKLQSLNAPDEQWERILNPIIDFLNQLPDFLGSFFGKNQQAILTIVLILSTLVSLKVAIAILDAVGSIPLLAPIFEIIGISYSTWFAFRYLLKAESRQELSHKVSIFKQQLFDHG
jgi:hypothetical protein